MLLMKNYFEEIKLKLRKQVEIEELAIVDNSHKHRGHKFFSPEKLHLHLKIKSSYLNSISRVNAQKIIMKTLEEDLKNKIHALEISIEQ
jgi:BolA protein